MCGIFGYAGNADSKSHDLLHELVAFLAVESEARGIDSTGFAARFDSGHTVVDKMPYRGSIFCDMSHKFDKLKKNMPSTFIGHTRLGTGSSPKIANNNHPFLGRRFHMVHNGVIPSWRDIVNKHQLSMTSETDSEIILRLLEKKRSKLGLKHSVEWILDNIWGNMAVALLDKEKPNIWLFRNQNPIHVFIVDKSIFGGEMCFFTSTKDIFDKAWKSVFNEKPSEELVSKNFLDDNHLFRISSNAAETSGKMSRFIVSRLDVKNKFRIKKQYYGTLMGSIDPIGRHSSSTTVTSFYSKTVDEDDVAKGCRFSDKQEKKMREVFKSKNGKESMEIDDMSIREYASLKTFVSNVKKADLLEKHISFAPGLRPWNSLN